MEGEDKTTKFIQTRWILLSCNSHRLGYRGTYNLMVAQKYFVIKQGYENKTIQTLRWKLIQVPARIIKTGRYIIFKIETVAEKFNHYLAMIKRIESIVALIA